jgi:large subunit ribosomal protein L19
MPTGDRVMTNKLIQYVEQEYLKKDLPQFRVGDTVDIHTRIIEGEKERIQVFTGTVIMKKGAGINETFTVRRIVNNEGVERIFPIHSPFIAKVVVRRSGETRRAKLFYLRDRVGKAVRLTETRKTKKEESTTSSSSESSQEQPALAGAAS